MFATAALAAAALSAITTLPVVDARLVDGGYYGEVDASPLMVRPSRALPMARISEAERAHRRLAENAARRAWLTRSRKSPDDLTAIAAAEFKRGQRAERRAREVAAGGWGPVAAA